MLSKLCCYWEQVVNSSYVYFYVFICFGFSLVSLFLRWLVWAVSFIVAHWNECTPWACVRARVCVCVCLHWIVMCYELQMLAHCENVNMAETETVDSTNSWNVPPCIAQNLTSKTQQAKSGAERMVQNGQTHEQKNNNNSSNSGNSPCLFARILWYDTVLNGARFVLIAHQLRSNEVCVWVSVLRVQHLYGYQIVEIKWQLERKSWDNYVRNGS